MNSAPLPEKNDAETDTPRPNSLRDNRARLVGTRSFILCAGEASSQQLLDFIRLMINGKGYFG
jgi:hypothetical protein